MQQGRVRLSKSRKLSRNSTPPLHAGYAGPEPPHGGRHTAVFGPAGIPSSLLFVRRFSDSPSTVQRSRKSLAPGWQTFSNVRMAVQRHQMPSTAIRSSSRFQASKDSAWAEALVRNRCLQILQQCCGTDGCAKLKAWQQAANTTSLCLYPGNLCRCVACTQLLHMLHWGCLVRLTFVAISPRAPSPCSVSLWEHSGSFEHDKQLSPFPT